METLCPLRAGNSAMLSFPAIKAVALVGEDRVKTLS